MQIRSPVVAGQFYPGNPQRCLEEVEQCLAEATLPAELPSPIVAGIVPHAGWSFSGRLAAQVFAAVKKQNPQVDTFIFFGTAHGYFGSEPVVDASDSWATPLGQVQIDKRLVDVLLDKAVVVADRSAHRAEHSIEVQIPFIQHLFPNAAIVPIIVPPNDKAVLLGQAIAKACRGQGVKVVPIGSTDLTHYGPRYGFTPMGAGAHGLEWAREVNDRRLIALILKMEPQLALANALENGSACGPGAIAAAIAFAKGVGSKGGYLLAHTTSNEVMLRETGSAGQDCVGYAAIVF